MRKGGGKAKGASFEREVCVALSKWISDGKHEDVFWRSAMSGGRSTVAKRKGKALSAQAGDLSAVHPIGNSFISSFYVECKFYKNLKYENLIKGTGTLSEFWQVAVREAADYGKLPLLIARQNNFPTVVCLNKRGLRTFMLVHEDLVLRAPMLDLNVCLFTDFLKVTPPK